VNHDALTALHRAHYDDLVRYFTRRGAAAESDVLAAEVFVIAWRKMPPDLDAPRPWLYGVARKVLGNARRTHDRRHSLDVRVDDGPDHARSPRVSTHSGQVAFRVDLQRAWNALPAGDQEILALVAWEGLTTVEAADALRIRRSSASMRLVRARTRLRALLAPAPSEARPAHLPTSTPDVMREPT
jgi:RNA polymerase sigma factor (sigma-70 family)